MRWCLSAIFVFMAAPVFGQAQENEAEKLYRAMEKKIKEAKSLKVVWTGELAGLGKSAKIKGSLHFAEGNKSRIEAEGDIPGLQSLRVSDGRQVATSSANGPVTTKPVQSKNFGSSYAGFLVPMGASIAFMGMSAIEEKGDFDINEDLSFDKFKLGAKERVGERDAQIVEFEMADKKRGIKQTPVRLWIDPRTLTPLKREMHDPANPKQTFMHETYTEFIIEPQLDAKLFELPR